MSKAEEQVRTIAAKVRPPLTRHVQKDDSGNDVEVGELPRALALVAAGLDPVGACEQIIDERVANSARSIRARDGDPYPPMDSYLPPGERRKRALDAIGEEAPDTADMAELARLRTEVQEGAKRVAGADKALVEAERLAAEKDAEIASLREALDAATAPEPEEAKS